MIVTDNQSWNWISKMVYQVTSAISASSPANDQLETIFFSLVGFYTGNKIPSPKKTSWETSTDLVSNSEMNCGNFFWRTLLFLQKFIPSQDVSIYAKEKLLHLEIRMLHWCLPYTLFMATYVGPGFPHTSTSFSGCASLQALCHSSGTSIYYSNNCVPVFCFFGAEEEQRSVFGVLDMLSYLLHQWQFHIKPVPARLSPPPPY